MQIDKSDLLKIKDAIDVAVKFHEKRDEMNAYLHLAEDVRYSPLTSRLQAEEQRLFRIITEGENKN